MTALRQLARLDSVVRSTPFNQEWLPWDYSIEWMSDTIVVIAEYPSEPDHDRGSVYQFPYLLGALQVELLSAGFLTRGAVSVARKVNGLATTSMSAFKPLSEAETELAVFPRILYGLDTYDAATREDHEFVTEGTATPYRTEESGIAYDRDDGLAFVDYLVMPVQGGDMDFFRLHRDTIRGGLTHPREPVRKKYRWLQHYHDDVVRSPGFCAWWTGGTLSIADRLDLLVAGEVRSMLEWAEADVGVWSINWDAQCHPGCAWCRRYNVWD